MFFIPVCDSVHGGVSVRETPVRLRAGGTHPTGMLSCFCISSVEAPLIVDGSFSPTPGSDLRPDVSIMFSLQFDKPVRTFKMETYSGSGFYVCKFWNPLDQGANVITQGDFRTLQPNLTPTTSGQIMCEKCVIWTPQFKDEFQAWKWGFGHSWRLSWLCPEGIDSR